MIYHQGSKFFIRQIWTYQPFSAWAWRSIQSDHLVEGIFLAISWFWLYFSPSIECLIMVCCIKMKVLFWLDISNLFLDCWYSQILLVLRGCYFPSVYSLPLTKWAGNVLNNFCVTQRNAGFPTEGRFAMVTNDSSLCICLSALRCSAYHLMYDFSV